MRSDIWGDPWLVSPDDTGAQLRNSILHYRCPACGRKGQLLRGPQGGNSINVLCESCGTRYNLGMFRNYLATVEIITPGPREVPAMERKFFRSKIRPD